jgi:hypothetical protein
MGRRPAVSAAVWFVVLAAVSLAPVALLVLRALARTWLTDAVASCG